MKLTAEHDLPSSGFIRILSILIAAAGFPAVGMSQDGVVTEVSVPETSETVATGVKPVSPNLPATIVPPAPDPDAVNAENVRNQVLALLPAERHFRELAADVISELYLQRGFRPVWDPNALNVDFTRGLSEALVAHAFPELLRLDPIELEPLITDATVDKTDLAHAVAFCDTALLIRLGFVPTEKIWSEWNEGDTPGSDDRSAETIIGDLVGVSVMQPFDIAKAIEEMGPQNWIYRELQKHYLPAKEAILKYSGLPSIPDPSTAGVGRPGEAYPYAPAVAAHLIDRGYLQMPAELAPTLSSMTPELVAALTAFQNDHGLETDGIFGPGSWQYLNENAADRYRAITINMHRARLLPNKFGERYIIANLPSAELFAFDANDFFIKTMRIVHGKASPETHRTKIFRDTMQEVVFGPYWNVPVNIAMKEIIPKAQEDWGYLSRNNYEIVDAFHSGSGQTYRLTPDTLQMVSQGKLLIRQKPGGENALGRVKFLFPNSYAIYMHDTPAKNFFLRSKRDYSHGCVRVAEPAELGEWVLGPQGWDADKVTSAMESGSRQHLAVQNKVNVYLTYLTMFPRPLLGGKIILAPARDVYELDDVDSNTLAEIIPWKQSAAPMIARPISEGITSQ